MDPSYIVMFGFIKMERKSKKAEENREEEEEEHDTRKN